MVSREPVVDNRQSHCRQGHFPPLQPPCYDAGRPHAAASEWIEDMNNRTGDLDQADEDILIFDVSDQALEAAATMASGAGMTFGTPTVSILVACCGND
jgi:hypothetical protein